MNYIMCNKNCGLSSKIGEIINGIYLSEQTNNELVIKWYDESNVYDVLNLTDYHVIDSKNIIKGYTQEKAIVGDTDTVHIINDIVLRLNDIPSNVNIVNDEDEIFTNMPSVDVKRIFQHIIHNTRSYKYGNMVDISKNVYAVNLHSPSISNLDTQLKIYDTLISRLKDKQVFIVSGNPEIVREMLTRHNNTYSRDIIDGNRLVPTVKIDSEIRSKSNMLDVMIDIIICTRGNFINLGKVVRRSDNISSQMFNLLFANSFNRLCQRLS